MAATWWDWRVGIAAMGRSYGMGQRAGTGLNKLLIEKD